MQNYDLAVVPSLWMETGPLTILEAFAAGIPVAGTNLGGIKEILTDKKCFLLPIDPLSWKNLFLNIMNKTMLSEFKSQNIRTFHDLKVILKIILKKILKNI